MLKTSGCRICGGRPMPKHESVFKLCQLCIDDLFVRVMAPLDHNRMSPAWGNLRNRTRIMRGRYAGAVRLLGW